MALTFEWWAPASGGRDGVDDVDLVSVPGRRHERELVPAQRGIDHAVEQFDVGADVRESLHLGERGQRDGDQLETLAEVVVAFLEVIRNPPAKRGERVWQQRGVDWACSSDAIRTAV